jgi:lysophospholipase L1-like esterase
MWKSVLALSSVLFLSACSQSALNNKATNEPTTFNSFTGERSRLIGRFDTNTPGQAQFTWPGSAIEFRFTGTTAKIALASTGDVRFQVEIDGVVQDLWVKNGEAIYTLASGLTQGEHNIRLTRLTESFALVTTLLGDPLVDGKLLPAPTAAQKRLLVIGDSITAGYGVEGADQTCKYSASTSNQQLTYAALAANALKADLHALAWSGIGAWRSYGEKTPVNPSILVRYQRTLADDINSRWNPTLYQPDAVLITIGTNDYWEGSVTDEYRTAMKTLITMVQTDYGDKPVYLIISPMLNGAARDSQKTILGSLVSTNVKVLDLGKMEPEDGLGCDWHPNKITNQRMGKALEQQLKTDLKW